MSIATAVLLAIGGSFVIGGDAAATSFVSFASAADLHASSAANSGDDPNLPIAANATIVAGIHAGWRLVGHAIGVHPPEEVQPDKGFFYFTFGRIPKSPTIFQAMAVSRGTQNMDGGRGVVCTNMPPKCQFIRTFTYGAAFDASIPVTIVDTNATATSYTSITFRVPFVHLSDSVAAATHTQRFLFSTGGYAPQTNTLKRHDMNSRAQKYTNFSDSRFF